MEVDVNSRGLRSKAGRVALQNLVRSEMGLDGGLLLRGDNSSTSTNAKNQMNQNKLLLGSNVRPFLPGLDSAGKAFKRLSEDGRTRKQSKCDSREHVEGCQGSNAKTRWGRLV